MKPTIEFLKQARKIGATHYVNDIMYKRDGSGWIFFVSGMWLKSRVRKIGEYVQPIDFTPLDGE